jgi:Thiolase, C-terminal domain
MTSSDRDLHDLGLLEVNEAFASVALHATRMLGADQDLVNVNGGSVALGHALGSTGARMIATLVHEMRRRHVTYGAATLCGGGGRATPCSCAAPPPDTARAAKTIEGADRLEPARTRTRGSPPSGRTVGGQPLRAVRVRPWSTKSGSSGLAVERCHPGGRDVACHEDR